MAATQDRATIDPASAAGRSETIGPVRAAPGRGRVVAPGGSGSGRQAAEAYADRQHAIPVALDDEWTLRHAGPVRGRVLGPRVA